MTSYSDFLNENDNAIAAFNDRVPAFVESCLKQQAELLAADAASEEHWKAYAAAREELIRRLVGAQLCIVRKVPTKQNEDTFGAEVQADVVGVIAKALGTLRGGGKDDSGAVVKKTAYLSSKATLLVDTHKERPEGYPRELDQTQMKALEESYARAMADSYHSLVAIAVEVKTLLEKNKDLINKPKRAFSTMM